MYELPRLIFGGMVTCLLLLAAHVALWPYQKHLSRLAAYTIGVACIGVGVSIVGLLLNEPRTVIAFWVVSGMAGAVIWVAWWIRGILDERDKRVAENTRAAMEMDDVTT